MTRKEEWERLRADAAQLPENLDDRTRQAIRRAGRRGTILRRTFGTLGTLAGAAALFAVLVNSSITFALAASRVPIVRELVEAVSLDPSLRKAVENDAVQLLKTSVQVGDVELTLEYLIADPRNLTVFYSLDLDQMNDKMGLRPELSWPDGGKPPVTTSYGEERAANNSSQTAEDTGWLDRTLKAVGLREPDAGVLYQWEFSLSGEELTPQMKLDITLEEEITIGERPKELAQTTVDLEIDPYFFQNPRVLPVNQTVEVLGQKLTIERLEIYPLHTGIVWHTDPENTGWLTWLPFYLEGDNGEQISGIRNGLSGVGGDRSTGGGETRLETAWYDTAETITICLDQAAVLDKNRAEARLYEDGHMEGLPNYIRTLSRALDGVEADGHWPKEIAVYTSKGSYTSTTDAFGRMTDADGKELDITSRSVWYDTETGWYSATELPEITAWPVTVEINFAPGEPLMEPIKITVSE